jgi:hypothetical protein
MRTIAAFATVLSLSAAVFACSGGSAQDGSGSPAQGPEQDVTNAKNGIVGSWQVEDASKNLGPNLSYEFRSDGSFTRQARKVLNGLFLPGHEPTQTESGTYTVDIDKKQVTLDVTSPRTYSETLAYAVQPGRVLNGIFLPGHEPPPSNTVLSLTGVPAPLSHIAFPTIKYDLVITTPGRGEGESCGGLAGLKCQDGLVCEGTMCCDVPGVCKRAAGN